METDQHANALLDRLTIVMRTLPQGAALDFASIFIGALSHYVTNEEWASCLGTALGVVTRQHAKAVQS